MSPIDHPWIDLKYESSSLCGPVDLRVVRFLEEYTGNQLDASYFQHVQRWHGGIPGLSYFTALDGKTRRVGRFLTLVDEKSVLEPPPRPSWRFPDRDARIDWSVLTLLDQEGPSCRQLFGGEEVLPFAALYAGPHHPDEASLTSGDVELLAFLYEPEHPRPQIVVWLPHEAAEEYRRWNKVLSASGYDEDEEVRYHDFTVPVAQDFDALLSTLRAEPEER